MSGAPPPTSLQQQPRGPPPGAPPPGALPPGVRPPGVGPPPGAYPPGVRPPGVGPPPGAYPPGVRPPGVGPPPGALPPGVRPPGVGPPPGAYPPGVAPAGALPPGVRPPGVGPPPGAYPPGQGPPRGPPLGPDGRPLVRPPQPALGPDGQPLPAGVRPPGVYPPGQAPVGPDGRPIVRPAGPPGQMPPGAVRPPPQAGPGLSASPPPPGQSPPPQARVLPPQQAAAAPVVPAARAPAPTPSAAATAAQAQFASQAKAREKAAAEQNLKDIWSVLVDEKESSKRAAAAAALAGVVDEASREATLLYVGSRGSGKTTLINAYMYKDRDDVPRPTTCLDYKYTRTSLRDAMSEEKAVSHFWELGGGRALVNLLDVPLTLDTLRDTMVVVTLDASRTSRVVEDAVFWLGLLRKRCDALLTTLRQRNPTVAASLVASAKRRVGETHTDLSRGLDPLPVPVLLCLHKFDSIKALEPESLRVLTRAVRAVAHAHGCALLCTSRAHRDTLLKLYRARVSEHLVNREGRKAPPPAFDHTQHISVAAGQDSWAQIGDAPSGGGSQAKTPLAAWSAAFARTFPPSADDREDEAEVTATVDLDAEKQIDASLAQREDDLKRLQRELDLRRKLNAKEDATNNAASGQRA